jgi:hypothetical protein
MNQLAQCSCCPTMYYVDLAQIARGLSRFACPVCGEVADYAEEQQADPTISQATRNAWGAIGAVAVVAGLFMFAHLADRVLDELTA